MDMDMASMAAASMSMASENLAVSYSAAITKTVMNTEEMAAQELLDMMPELPSIPAVPKGQYIDVYA